MSATSSRFSLNLQFKDCVRIVAVLGLPLLVRRTPVVTIADLRKEREKENATCSTIDFKDMVECSSAHPSPKATVKVGGIVVAVINEFTRFDLILESHLTYTFIVMIDILVLMMLILIT